jgi:hypothetical protein
MTYIGATGENTFDDKIEDASTTLVNRIVLESIYNSNYSDKVGIWGSNYSDKVGIWGSNYSDLVGMYSSNYSDKVGIWGSNYTDKEIIYTSNYVKITSNILVERTKQLEDRVDDLEGTDGDPGDPDADPPIPPIPPTGNFAVLATLGLLAAGATATGILITDLTTKVNDLDDKVDLNAIYGSNYSDKVGVWSSNYSDKVGVWSSNYSDKVGIWGSNYSDKVGMYSSNYSDKVGIWGSNYSDKIGVWGSNYSDKVGIYSSNYSDKVGVWGSNYSDKVGIWGSNYSDKVGGWSSNYSDKVGIFGSNYTDKIGIFGSNYSDKVGIWGSNYSDKVGIFGSNYTDKIGIFGSNYSDKVGIWGSNYSDKVGMYSSNYSDKVGIWGSNYSDKIGVWGSNYSDKVGIYSSNYSDKVGVWGSNYSDKVGIYSSNYSDKVGVWGSNYSDKVGVWGSNYSDKVGVWGSNYSDKVGVWGSNYNDKVGVWGSNYSDKVGIYSSNYSDKVGVWGSNYSDKVGVWGSNYSDKVGVWGSNYSDKVGVWGSNYNDKVGVWGSNYSDKVGIYGSNYTDLQVIYTSNYVERINTELGVRVDNTSNYVATKQDILTASLLLPYFNTMDFLVANDKIKLTAPVQIGYYTLNVSGARSMYVSYSSGTAKNEPNLMIFNATDRNASSYYNSAFQYNNDPTSYSAYKGVLNYNAGDRIQFKIKIDGRQDYTNDNGTTYYNKFGFWRIATNNPSGRTDWPKDTWYYTANPTEPYRVRNMDYYFQQLFSWSPDEDSIDNYQDYENIYSVAKYNDEFIYTLEAGYVYYFTRRVYIPYGTSFEPIHGATYTNPIMIKVNDPYITDAFSYIPRLPVAPAPTQVPSVSKKTMSVNKGVAIQTSTSTFNVVDNPVNYELSTGFNYDETSNIIKVFDGNYNNLTNKPDATISLNDTNSSNYTKRINTELTTEIGGKAPTSHTHIIGDTTGLQTALDGKAPTSHTHTTANITGLDTALAGKAPTSHTHIIGDTTGLQTALDGKAPTSHTHTTANITGLDTALAGKAPTSHTHTIANITNLQTTLDGKAPTSHTHSIANITSLQTTLDGKASTSHTHAIADITSLQTTLDGKASTSHTHAIADITNLQTTLAATQPSIISTAGQLIIGNGDGLTTTSTGLTWATNTLTATNLTTTTTLTTANLAVSTQATLTRLLTAGLDADMFILANNATNNLRFNQVFQALNDQKWILKQKSNNVDYNLFNFRGGKIAVGTQANPAYMLDVVGDVNITGDFLKNANVYKPANAVLADTASVATKLATARTIAGTSFDGSANINIDYFALNNKPIILQPTTTNLQLTSGYTFAFPSYVSIGTTAIATNVLQVGAGGRLRISNGTTDYTLLGTIDTDGATNTSIVISGTTRSTNAGNIQYLATASSGSHIFYTSPTTTTRMTISSSGVNVNNDLGVSGKIGVGTAPHATYKVDVNGTLNATSVLVGGSAITGSKWTTATDTTRIFYNSGNVGIGTTNPGNILQVGINRLQIANGATGFTVIGTSDTEPNTRITLFGGSHSGAAGQISYVAQSTGRHVFFTTNSFNERMIINSNGNVVINNNLAVANINATSYVLGTDIYGRNGYDTRMFANSTGMYIYFGTVNTGDNTFLEISASYGATNIDSNSSRPIYFRVNGFTWQFLNNGNSRNAYNTTLWTVICDHRIKENIKKANLNICYNNVKNINLYRFNYINGFNKGTQHDKTQLGFIAQQVQQHYPKSVLRNKSRIEDKREIPDLASVSADQINFTLFGAVKQLMKVVEKQSKRIKKLEEQLGIIDDDIVEDDADEPYERIVCDEVDIDTIEPSEPVGV